jgi:hypothetical protein
MKSAISSLFLVADVAHLLLCKNHRRFAKTKASSYIIVSHFLSWARALAVPAFFSLFISICDTDVFNNETPRVHQQEENWRAHQQGRRREIHPRFWLAGGSLVSAAPIMINTRLRFHTAHTLESQLNARN